MIIRSPYSEAIQTWFSEGTSDFNDGVPFEDNPYNEETPASEAWMEGFESEYFNN